MTGDDEAEQGPAQLPVAPASIRAVTLAELDRLGPLVQDLPLETWGKRSAAKDWSMGDVVAHLSLSLMLAGSVLDAAAAGRGAGTLWKAFGQVTKKVVPAASPAFNAINSALPRLIDRTLAPEVVKGQFAARARTVREKLQNIDPKDYTRPVYYVGRPWPLSFFLALLVNELAVHGWDIESQLVSDAHLSAAARSVLPLFYWSGTPFMLQTPSIPSGTVQVTLQDPGIDLWWRIEDSKTEQGLGIAESPDVTISGESGAFVLVLAGRLLPQLALEATSLTATGNADLARAFLEHWRLL